MLLVVLLYALFALSFFMGKLLLTHYTPPVFLAGTRMTLAGLILLSYQYFFSGRTLPTVSREHWWRYTQIIVVGIYAAYTLRFCALRCIPATKAGFLYNFSPLFSALYSYFFFKETPTRQQFLGLCIGIFGALLILTERSVTLDEITGLGSYHLPELLLLLSIAMHAYGWTLVRVLATHDSYCPVTLNGITMFVGGILSLITSLCTEGCIPIANPLSFFALLLAVVMISNVVCHTLYGILLQRYTTTFLSLAGLMWPLFGAFYGRVFLDEPISYRFYSAALIVCCGILLFYRDESREQSEQLKTVSTES